MKREVRPSRFQVNSGNPGVPPLKTRRLVFVSPFSLVAEPQPGVHALPALVRRGARVPASACPHPGPAEVDSARKLEAEERQQLARAWVVCAREVEPSSNWIEASLPDDALLHAFEDRAPTTLKEHHQGWRRWTCYCLVASVNCATPSLAEVANFLDGLAVGSFLDRGQKRRGSAIAVLSAMQFAAWKLGLDSLQKVLQTPLVAAWKRSSDWHKALPKEAVPLPLSILQHLEAAVAAQSEDSAFIGGLLLMCWGGLRWSDIQRLTLDSVLCSDGSLRGQCWRTKSRKGGMVWGCLTQGFYRSDWGILVFKQIQEARAKHAGRDFLLACNGRPMSYSLALGQFRRCLHVHCGLELAACSVFSLHSLKATLLAYANLLSVSSDLRAAQGHHKADGVSRCVDLYGRSEISTQLQCQAKICEAVQGGWVPKIPLQRGLTSLKESWLFAMSKTCGVDEHSSTSSDSDSSSDTSSQADSDADSVALDEGAVAPNPDGPWVLNCVSGTVHKAIVEKPGDTFSLACRPGAELHSGYVLRFDNPCQDGFHLCGHSGCRGRQQA